MSPETPGAPLIYHAAQLLGEARGSVHDYAVSGVTIPLDDDLHLADPIEGHVHLVRTNRGLFVTADLATAIEGQCSRCLKPIEIPLELRIEEEALPRIDIATGAPIDVTAEPDVLRLTDHHELDLEPVVREAISLAEPIAPLCRVDCPGLCVTCGEPLEHGDHDHPDETIDPRLEVLRAFRVDGADQTG
jgi:uncharacterized protein